MGTVAANTNNRKAVRTLWDIVSERHSPAFFETDFVTIVLPLLQESEPCAAGVLDDQGRLCGMLTERSILRKIFSSSADRLISSHNLGKYIADMKVEDAMIAAPDTLEETLSIEDAAALMLRRGYRYMPVVSSLDPRQLLGIVSERELARHLQAQLQETRKSERAQRSLLSYMLAEPYGCAWKPAEG